MVLRGFSSFTETVGFLQSFASSWSLARYTRYLLFWAILKCHVLSKGVRSVLGLFTRGHNFALFHFCEFLLAFFLSFETFHCLSWSFVLFLFCFDWFLGRKCNLQFPYLRLLSSAFQAFLLFILLTPSVCLLLFKIGLFSHCLSWLF